MMRVSVNGLSLATVRAVSAVLRVKAGIRGNVVLKDTILVPGCASSSHDIHIQLIKVILNTVFIVIIVIIILEWQVFLSHLEISIHTGHVSVLKQFRLILVLWLLVVLLRLLGKRLLSMGHLLS
jgi:hypothetical protein